MVAFMGVDVGTRFLKGVLVEGDTVLAGLSLPCPTDVEKAVGELWERLAKEVGLRGEKAVGGVAAVGAGREAVKDALYVSVVTALAKGAAFAAPDAGLVLDIGAESACAVRYDASGRVLDFAMADKCAAGTGVFLEAMAHALDVEQNELPELALRGSGKVKISAQCVVFAESEVVGLIHAGVPREEIAAALYQALAARAVSLLHRVCGGRISRVVVAGGLGCDKAFVKALARSTGCEVVAVENPHMLAALGAALFAQQKGEQPR
ncbi:MAG: 2-hydroxyglutaryl-CoA dehydratase [Planctomycetota bacterium]|nr:MAG: 2-hydroxyglutaryl-CoA dehydratase [Planctomycetota bacterium]